MALKYHPFRGLSIYCLHSFNQNWLKTKYAIIKPGIQNMQLIELAFFSVSLIPILSIYISQFSAIRELFSTNLDKTMRDKGG